MPQPPMPTVRRPKQTRAATKPRPVARARLGQEILRIVRERILAWHYPPGHHLGEQALCDEFAASRIPVREALRALAEQGLVDQRPNQGCYVRQLDADAIHQLYDMRLVLETYVVECLAKTGLPTEVVSRVRAVWEPRLDTLADDPVDGVELVRADEEFHLELARAAGNAPIVKALAEINDRLRFVRLVVISNPHRAHATAGEHLKIVEAIEQRDAPAARRFLRQNINHARNKVEIAISKAFTAANRHGR